MFLVRVLKFIILFFCLFCWICTPVYSSDKSIEERVRLVNHIMDNNLAFTKDVNSFNILQWKQDLIAFYQKNNDIERVFLIRQMAIQAQAFHGNITETLNEAKELMKEAQRMDYNKGIVISHIAIGNTYFNASMKEEATEEYEKALRLLHSIPNSGRLQERVYTTLIPCLIELKRMNEVETYLNQMNSLYENSGQNHFLLYVYQAYYCLQIKDTDKAHKFLNDAEEWYNKYPFSFHNFLLKYMQAEYARQTGNYKQALSLYTGITNETNYLHTYMDILKQKAALARIYTQQGNAKEACAAYQDINNARDSIYSLNYTSQINLIRTTYQVNNLETKNQDQRNRLLLYFIIGSILILVILVFVVLHIRKENKQLSESKRKLDEARLNAENSIRTKSLFLSNMSHEIRTPLNALSGFSGILTDPNIDNDTRQQCNEIIQQNSELLMKLIDDVVDLSSLELGKMQFSLGTHDAVFICRNVVDTVDKIKQTAAAIYFKTSLEKLELYTDEARLQQLLINLLINTTKFTSEGSITLTLEKQSDECALFSVTDTGCGIAPEKQGQIFNRFEKLNENAQGSGLGLSICQLIIEHFGGKIWIDTNYTNGCRFVFTHPIRPSNQKEGTK